MDRKINCHILKLHDPTQNILIDIQESHKIIDGKPWRI